MYDAWNKKSLIQGKFTNVKKNTFSGKADVKLITTESTGNLSKEFWVSFVRDTCAANKIRDCCFKRCFKQISVISFDEFRKNILPSLSLH